MRDLPVEAHVQRLFDVDAQPADMIDAHPAHARLPAQEDEQRGQREAGEWHVLDGQHVQATVVRVGAAQAQAEETAEDRRVDHREM